MTDDDRLDELLRDAAVRDYNAPPAATPRDEMWERIAAARAARRTSAPAVGAADDDAKRAAAPTAAPDVIVLPVRRWHHATWARALAAALLVAVGIGVGRISVTGDRSTRTVTDSDRVASADTRPTPTRPPSSEALRGSNDSSPTRLAAATPRGEHVATRGTPATTTYGNSVRDTDDASSSSADSAEAAAVAPATLPYRLAAAQHLALTETLLTAVSADARAGRADSSVAVWARDLLGTTRMLLDSPAARDPKLARLLQDLELVLAEVAQLHPTRGSEELRAIDRAVRQRGVLTRLRATMPAGHLSAGT